MIISHKHKFIFIKNQKTAGTSHEIALSKICGPDDIITPISPEDEEIRKSSGFREAQNYLQGGNTNLYTVKSHEGIAIMNFYNHIPAVAVKAGLINEHIWNDYYKFSFERNPFDKVISWYYFEYRDQDSLPPIKEFISSLKSRLTGFDLYAIDDKISQFRKNRDHYSKLINSEVREIIEAKFKREIDYFGYQFLS